MRICHLLYDDPENPWLGGGGAMRAREIYARLADRHEITLVSGPFPGAEPETERDGIRVVRVGRAHTYTGSRLAYCRRAVRELQSRRWDLWVNDFSAYAPLRVPRTLRRRGILTVHHLVGHHALRRHPLIGSIALAAEHRAIRTYPNILTVSRSYRDRILELTASPLPTQIPKIARYLTNSQPRSHRLTNGGESPRDSSTRVPNGVECIPNGVGEIWLDSDSPNPGASLESVGGTNDSPDPGTGLAGNVLYFGRIDIYQKGLDILLKAFAMVAADYPGLILHLAGDGPADQVLRVRRMVKELGIDRRVQILGRVTQARLVEMASEALFVTMPSRFEGQGIVALEAAARGKAVVATHIPGLQEAVINDETGLAVPSEDAPALANGMRQLLEDPSLRKRLGDAGRARVQRRFRWSEIVIRVEQAYRRVAEGG